MLLCTELGVVVEEGESQLRLGMSIRLTTPLRHGACPNAPSSPLWAHHIGEELPQLPEGWGEEIELVLAACIMVPVPSMCPIPFLG